MENRKIVRTSNYKQNRLKTTWARARYFFALIKKRIAGSITPIICVLVVNNRCNFNCKYCFGCYANRRNPDYTTEELKTLINDLHRMGVRYLNIHGGETLLRKDIGEIVEYIKRKGIYCCLITNGSLLKDKLNEIRSVDNLTISLDGRKINNDRNRGNGTHDIALNAIKLAVKEEIPLRVSATITKYTMNDIDYLAKLGKELGFTVLFSIMFKPLPEAKEFEMTNEEIRYAMGQIIEFKKNGYPIFTSLHAAKFARDWPLDHNKHHFIEKKDWKLLPKGFKHIECFYGKNKFTIEADGRVYPCFLLIDHFEALDWRVVGIEKAIHHVKKENKCITCPALSQNDHNLLLGLNISHVGRIIIDQLKESLRRR